MPSSVTEEIKNRLNIVDVIATYIRLDKAGKDYKAVCPFHSEKTPSFFVSEDKQIWHCFGCGEGGDIFGFVMKIEGVEFKESLRMLAEKAGVQLSGRSFDKTESDKKERIYAILQHTADKWHEDLLHTEQGKQALEYLRSRTVTGDTINAFNLGYAVADWHALEDHLKQFGYTAAEMRVAGLLIASTRDPSRFYDRFRGRITFPIRDAIGRTVGFSARILEIPAAMQTYSQPPAKYINTPNTIVYDKSRALFNIDKARQPMRAVEKVILVEGNMDAMMSWQAGVENVIASSGTALSQDQITVLKRYAPEFILCFDADTAGEAATRRTLFMLLEQGVRLKIIHITQGKDPADLVRTDPEFWRNAVAGAQPFMEYLTALALEKHNAATADGKVAVMQDVGEFLSKITNPVERAHWTAFLADRLRVSEQALVDFLAQMHKNSPVRNIPRSATAARVKDKSVLLQESLLTLALRKPELVTRIRAEWITDEELRGIFDYLMGVWQKEGRWDTRTLFYNPRLSALIAQAEFEWEGSDVQAEFAAAAHQIEQHAHKEVITDITRRLKIAEQENNTDEVANLSQALNDLLQQLNGK